MDDEFILQLSGIQHFAFCRRQWALIHLEGLWEENVRTVEGELLHNRAHQEGLRERRGDVLIIRSLTVYSRQLGLSGKCDVVEFHQDTRGVPLRGEEGLWLPYPVEYKRGAPKENDADELQLCAQAICLEEMLCCQIEDGALFYGETHRRFPVRFEQTLRQRVEAMVVEMREYASRGYTPHVKSHKGCTACSLREVCLPRMERAASAEAYVAAHIREEDKT